MATEYTAAQRERDEGLSRAVRRALYEQPVLQEQPLEAIACQGVVELRGTVPTADLREFAEQQAMAAPGVSRVVNHIQIDRAHRA